MKDKLRKNVEKKCNEDGYITTVYSITKHSYGEIPLENLMCATVFDVTYTGQICIPVLGTQIVCKVQTMNKALIAAENGPILVVIMIQNINTDNFAIDTLDNITSVKTKTRLSPQDYVKVTVKNKRLHKGDTQIHVIGALDDIATQAEVDTYFNQVKQVVLDSDTLVPSNDVAITDEPESNELMSTESSSNIIDI
jgi:hypothetical protein